MSVWRDMGFRADGTPFGVDPETFLVTAYYLFWDRLRRACWPDGSRALPYFDFNFRRKCGDGGRYEFEKWQKLGEYLSFPADTSPPPYRAAFARPARIGWSGPEWPHNFALTEGNFLGGPVIPCPYSSTFRDVMGPDWPRQRLQLIREMRYAVVPVDITGGGAQQDRIDDTGFVWRDGLTVTAAAPAYWARSATYMIGITGERGKFIPSDVWESSPWSVTYNGPDTSQALYIYGVADLATHPDFAEFFDIA